MTAKSLRAVLRDYKKSDWRADLVLVTGDLVQDDSAKAYGRLRKMLRKLNLPTFLTPGNHDVPALMAELFSEPPFELCPTTIVGGWQLIGLSTYVPDSAGGTLHDSELERLVTSLETHPGMPALVYLHHPPIDLGSAWLDSVGLSNKQELFRCLRRFDNVRCILSGHAHQEVEERVENIQILGTPSTCRQFKPKSDDFMLDTLPPAYRRISLDTDGKISSTVQWLNHD